MSLDPTVSPRIAGTGPLPAPPTSAPAPAAPPPLTPVASGLNFAADLISSSIDAHEPMADLPQLGAAWDDNASQSAKQAAIDEILANSSKNTRDFINFVAKPNFGQGAMNAVYQLAAEGKLDALNPNGASLRDRVADFLKSSDQGGVNVAQAVLQQIANPDGNVFQAQANTCSAAIAQKTLADNNPSEYFRLATDVLAQGACRLPNGDKIELSTQNRAWIDAQGFTDTQKMDAMVQAALMDYANGAASFDIAKDQSSVDGDHVYQGLGISQATKLDSALLAAPTLDPRAGSDQAALTAQVEQAHASGAPGVFVPLTVPGDPSRAHMVLVQGIQDGQATVLAPDGRPQQVPVADLVGRIATLGDQDGGIGTSSAPPPQAPGGKRR